LRETVRESDSCLAWNPIAQEFETCSLSATALAVFLSFSPFNEKRSTEDYRPITGAEFDCVDPTVITHSRGQQKAACYFLFAGVDFDFLLRL